MLETIAAEPRYAPNEENLTVTGLHKKLSALRESNTDVTQAKVEMSNARLALNAALYEGEGNMHETAQAVKEYVKSVFGFDSEQYHQLVKLHLTKPKK